MLNGLGVLSQLLWLFVFLSSIPSVPKTSSRFSQKPSLALSPFGCQTPEGIFMGKAGRCQSAGQCGIKHQQPPSLLVVKELGGSDHFLDRVENTLFLAVDVS